MEVEAKLRSCVKCKWNKGGNKWNKVGRCREESCGHHKGLEDEEEQERIESKGW